MIGIALVAVALMAACTLPLCVRMKQGEQRLLLTLACSFYGVFFGLRAIYLAAFPQVLLFPSIDPQQDTTATLVGLSWTLLGVIAMIVTYLLMRPSHRYQSARMRIVDSALAFGSQWPVLGVMYLFAWAARFYMVRTGAAFWFYNSATFAQLGRPVNEMVMGPLSLLDDCGPVVCGAMLAKVLSRPGAAYTKVWIGMICGAELLYYTITAYKFGIFGSLIIPCVIFSLRRPKGFMRRLFVVAVVIVAVVIPVINEVRESTTGLYMGLVRNGGTGVQQFASDWAGRAGDASTNVYAGSLGDRVGLALDGFFLRLTGAEAVTAAEKYREEPYWGRTYLNVLMLAVPRVLRPWSSEPFIIPWETEFVGEAPDNRTIVPMPMIVEAYLNFGIIGVLLIMCAFGGLYRYVDSYVVVARENAFAAGCYAYLCWRLLNLEHNIYVYALPPAKLLICLVMVLGIAGKCLRPRCGSSAARVPAR